MTSENLRDVLATHLGPAGAEQLPPMHGPALQSYAPAICRADSLPLVRAAGLAGRRSLKSPRARFQVPQFPGADLLPLIFFPLETVRFAGGYGVPFGNGVMTTKCTSLPPSTTTIQM